MSIKQDLRPIDTVKKVFVWRVMTILFAIPGVILLALRPGFTLLKPGFSFENFVNMWANFDGLNFLNLAKYGYGTPFTHLDYSFLPVYPWLIGAFNWIQSYVFTGLLISNIAFAVALYFLHKLCRMDYSHKVADYVIILFLFFPTSFFFGSIYNESIFLLLAIASFYSIRKKKIFLACAFAAVASATGVTGIFLWPAIIWEIWHMHGGEIKKMLNPDSIWLLLPPLGILSYMNFQFQKTGNAWLFITGQPEKLILIHQVFYRYARMLIFVNHTDPLFFTILLEFLTGSIFMALCLYGLKKLRPSYSIFIILSYFLPTFTGTFSGMPRYVLVLFPAFFLLSDILCRQSIVVRKLVLAVCVIFSFLAITLFTRGYFIG